VAVVFQPVVGVFENLQSCKQQEGPEDVESPAEVLNERRTKQNEDKPQYQREPHTYQQRLAPQLPRHSELRENHQEDEYVIDRERLLGYVTGEILLGKLWTPDTTNDEGEQQRQNDVDGRLNRRLSKGRLVRVPHLINEIDCQDGY